MSRKSTQHAAPNESAHARSQPKRRRRRRWLELGVALLLVPLLVWLALRALLATPGIATITDSQVAVLVDYRTGEERLITNPGYRAYVPWLQEVHHFDKSPNAFLMKGNDAVGLNQVPRLLVRANDSSSFWFDDLVLQYALMPDRAALVLEDSGGGEAYKETLMRAHVRSILRDEFGRFSSEDCVRPENLKSATVASLTRLNAALNPHGIEVLEISTPKPTFDTQYEAKINRRKVANQEVEHLKAQIAQLAQERVLRLQAVQKDKDLEAKKLENNLIASLGNARKELIRARAEADNVYFEEVSQGRAARIEKVKRAEVLRTKYELLAADMREHLAKLETDGETSVRAALVDKLAEIEFVLLPYSRDQTPQRIEHENVPSSASGAKK